MSLAAIMRIERFEVDCANDGFAGIEKAKSMQPHAVVLDIGMPRMTGFELAKRLRQLPGGNKLFIVAISGRYVTAADRVVALEAGIDRHFVKPADPLKLMSLLRQTLSAPS